MTDDPTPRYSGRSKAIHVTEDSFSPTPVGPDLPEANYKGISQQIGFDPSSPAQWQDDTIVGPYFQEPVYKGRSKAIHVRGDAAVIVPPDPVPGCDCCAEQGDCGVTDSFSRLVVDDWGVSDSGATWQKWVAGDESSQPFVNGAVGSLHYLASNLGMSLPFTDSVFEASLDFTITYASVGPTLEAQFGLLRSAHTPFDNTDFVDLYYNSTLSRWELRVWGSVGGSSIVVGFSIVSGYTYRLTISVDGSAFTATLFDGVTQLASASASHTPRHEAFSVLMYQESADDTLTIDNLDLGTEDCGEEEPPTAENCPLDNLTDTAWEVTTNNTDGPGLETEVADEFIAARQIAGTSHGNGEFATLAMLRDLGTDTNVATMQQEGTYRFPYRIFGDYDLSDFPFPYARVRARVSTMSSSVQVAVERGSPSGSGADDIVTVVCPSAVGGTFTIPRTMDPGFIDIAIGTGTTTVTVQGVSHTYSPGGLTPDPDSVRLIAEIGSTSTGTPLNEGRIGPMYFIPSGGGSVPWCTGHARGDCTGGDPCAECEDPLNPGFQIPPFTPGYLPTFRRQIGDPTTNLDSTICTLESAAMVLDWHTRGAVKVWGGELIPYCGKTEAQIAATGANLGNARTAWLHWSQTLSVRSGQTFSDMMNCLAEGRAVILQGDYGELNLAERCQDNFEDGHAISLYPYQVSNRILRGDPLCSNFNNIRISTLQRYAETLGIAVYGVTSPQRILFAVSRPWAP